MNTTSIEKIDFALGRTPTHPPETRPDPVRVRSGAGWLHCFRSHSNSNLLIHPAQRDPPRRGESPLAPDFVYFVHRLF